jgi:hypothetical protein
VQFLQQHRDVCRLTALLELLVDGLDGVVTLGVGEGGGLHGQSPEASEDLPGQNPETAAAFDAGVGHRLRTVRQCLNAREALAALQPRRVEAEAALEPYTPKDDRKLRSCVAAWLDL